MNLIGTLFKEDGNFLICNSIIEIDSELYISCNVKIKREEIFDLSAYGIEAEKVITRHLKIEDYHRMTIQEIYEASQQSTRLRHLVEYLRDEKINQILLVIN
jgi:hypothetical protein